MNVKVFELPSFEEWRSKDYKYHDCIGVFHCTVERFAYGENETYFKLAVADFEVPSNFNVDQIMCLNYTHKPCEPDAVTKLKVWYNSLQGILNNRWSEYIMKTYLVNN